MDILILAAAIFGLSSCLSRANTTHESAFVDKQHASCVKTTPVLKYSKDQLLAVKSTPVPAPDLLVLRRLATYGLNPEPWPHAPPLPKRKTRRGTAGGRHRRICRVTGHRPPPPQCLPDAPAASQVNVNNLIRINCDNVFSDSSNNVRVASLNTQSCRNKCTEIRDLIEEKKIDVLCITESWLKDSGDEAYISAMCPATHKVASFPRVGRSGGGIAFVYNKSLGNPSFSNVNGKSCEAGSFSFSHSIRFNIICIYKPPSENVPSFVNDFKNFLTSLKIKNQPFIILGDFNIKFRSENSQ